MSVKNLISNISSDNDVLYLALISMYSELSIKDSKKRSFLPELVYLLDRESLINLINYFEGEVLQVPKKSVLKDKIYGILSYYYYEVKMIKDWKSISKKLSLPYSQQLESKLVSLKNEVESNLLNIKLPNLGEILRGK